MPGRAPTASPGCTESGAGAQQYCPTWQSPFDQSAVWGTKIASENAGTSADCPNSGSIACLLLKAVTTSKGPFPDGLFVRTTYIQRADTEGGSPPTTSCITGQLAQVPYTAEYRFYAAH